MCGINGFISKSKIPDAEYRIKKMNDALIHRGPNAEGQVILQEGKAALGQRRLSVIDLDERANQPMRDNAGMAYIVYNGEIYNYKELKKSLDYSFKTESDTEVLMAGLLQEGVEWIKKCNGMYGVALYNTETKQTILIRDRMGIKPLYYYNDGQVCVFSSEIKGILNSGLVSAKFNYDAVDEYLGNRYVREPYTFFEDIYQLEAGCYMVIEPDLSFSIKRYWDIPADFNMDEDYDEEHIYENFKVQVNNAIERRMIADVPVGTYLSGGVDSSLISALASMKTDKVLNTYTIGFLELNEFEYARLVAEKYGTNHHEILLDKGDYLKNIEKIIAFKDAPLGVPNEIPLAIMSEELKKNITVVLSGEGADELMGGYGRIFRAPFDFENIDSGKNKDFYSYFIDRYEYVPRSLRDRYLSCSMKYRDEFDAAFSEDFNKYSNEQNVFRFFHKSHVKGLLQRVDCTTMYASVEARVPFLDHELIEFVYKNVPYSLKLKWNSKDDMFKAETLHSSEYSEKLDTPKYLLKKYSLEILPENVVTREKMGFPVPLKLWSSEIRDMAYEWLKDADWIKPGVLEDLCRDCENNLLSSQLLWMFINVQILKKMYFDKEWKY